MKSSLLHAVFALVLLTATAHQMHAAVVFTVEQVGSEVELTGSGTLDTAGLTLFASNGAGAGALVFPANGAMYGGGMGHNVDYYIGNILGPSSFGSGGITNATVGSGEYAGIFGEAGRLFVTTGYVSGSAISDTATFANASFSTLGIMPGTYTYTWGTGATADSLTINVVPEPSSWAMLLGGTGLLGLVLLCGRLRRG